jgi:glycolate oxidase FAD binding subunit
MPLGNVYRPESEAEASETIAEAAIRGTTLSIEGGGTKAAAGRPMNTDAVLSASAIVGIVLYEPNELVVRARAGAPVDAVVALLSEHGQELPFEPADLRGVFASQGIPTLGALAAMNLSGPRRIASGAARDYLLGVRFINGRGEIIKSGGRVMKNVTGLDLVKLMAGAWGTLGLLTEVTFKVLPIERCFATLIFSGMTDVAAIATLTDGMGSGYQASGAAHLPARSAGESARTVLRLEGSEASVAIRSEKLRRYLAAHGASEILEDAASRALWRDIRDVAAILDLSNKALWKISVAPDRGAAVSEMISRQVDARWFYDWSGGLIWLAVDASGDAGATAVRGALQRAGGHATLVRAPEELRRSLSVFEPITPAFRVLTLKLKHAFDPAGIFNPGRMYKGI